MLLHDFKAIEDFICFLNGNITSKNNVFTPASVKTGRDTSSPLGFHVIKIGRFPVIIHLPFDEVRVKSSRDL